MRLFILIIAALCFGFALRQSFLLSGVFEGQVMMGVWSGLIPVLFSVGGTLLFVIAATRKS